MLIRKKKTLSSLQDEATAFQRARAYRPRALKRAIPYQSLPSKGRQENKSLLSKGRQESRSLASQSPQESKRLSSKGHQESKSLASQSPQESNSLPSQGLQESKSLPSQDLQESKSLLSQSAEFDETLNICRLSREDRRSQPNAFRRQTGSPIDYLENQCVRSLPDCRYNVRQGSSVISMDELQFAASQGECEALCDQARGFTCRAFTYSAGEKRCYLSGDDSVSLSNAPLILKREAIYAEKQCSI
ncbi:unnamed protein product, partial [Timema podura]|nr:unnamed protein product [Timema podura]